MIVESTCRECGTHFDGHWCNLKHGHIWDTVPCPKCKSKNIHVVTDESHEPPENYRPFPGDSPVDYDNWI